MNIKTIPVKVTVAKVFPSLAEVNVVDPLLSPVPQEPPFPQSPVYTIEGLSLFRVTMTMGRP